MIFTDNRPQRLISCWIWTFLATTNMLAPGSPTKLLVMHSAVAKDHCLREVNPAARANFQQRALQARWQSVWPNRCNYTTMKPCCGCRLPSSIRKKGWKGSCLNAWSRGTTQSPAHSPVCSSSLSGLSPPLGKSQSLKKATWTENCSIPSKFPQWETRYMKALV